MEVVTNGAKVKPIFQKYTYLQGIKQKKKISIVPSPKLVIACDLLVETRHLAKITKDNKYFFAKGDRYLKVPEL